MPQPSSERRGIGVTHCRYGYRRELVVSDQVNMLAVGTIDGAENALAEPRRVPDDWLEQRKEIGRRIRNQAQHLRGRRLTVAGFTEIA
jgi:hypothetical protein